MKTIAESVELCRLCGHESEGVRSIFENPDLIKDLMFYLPLEVSYDFDTCCIFRSNQREILCFTDQSRKSLPAWNLSSLLQRFFDFKGIFNTFK